MPRLLSIALSPALVQLQRQRQHAGLPRLQSLREGYQPSGRLTLVTFVVDVCVKEYDECVSITCAHSFLNFLSLNRIILFTWAILPFNCPLVPFSCSMQVNSGPGLEYPRSRSPLVKFTGPFLSPSSHPASSSYTDEMGNCLQKNYVHDSSSSSSSSSRDSPPYLKHRNFNPQPPSSALLPPILDNWLRGVSGSSKNTSSEASPHECDCGVVRECTRSYALQILLRTFTYNFSFSSLSLIQPSLLVSTYCIRWWSIWDLCLAIWTTKQSKAYN